MAYPLLLSPLRIGPVEIRNRIVSTAHQTTLVEDGVPTDDFVAYHAARAEGGVGADLHRGHRGAPERAPHGATRSRATTRGS